MRHPGKLRAWQYRLPRRFILLVVVPFLHLVWAAGNLDRAGRPVVLQLLGVGLAVLGWYLERLGG